MEERMTLCNMVIEADAKNGVIPADSTTYKYLEVREVTCSIQFKIWWQIGNELWSLDLDNLHINRIKERVPVHGFYVYIAFVSGPNMKKWMNSHSN